MAQPLQPGANNTRRARKSNEILPLPPPNSNEAPTWSIDSPESSQGASSDPDLPNETDETHIPLGDDSSLPPTFTVGEGEEAETGNDTHETASPQGRKSTQNVPKTSPAPAFPHWQQRVRAQTPNSQGHSWEGPSPVRGARAQSRGSSRPATPATGHTTGHTATYFRCSKCNGALRDYETRWLCPMCKTLSCNSCYRRIGHPHACYSNTSLPRRLHYRGITPPTLSEDGLGVIRPQSAMDRLVQLLVPELKREIGNVFRSHWTVLADAINAIVAESDRRNFAQSVSSEHVDDWSFGQENDDVRVTVSGVSEEIGKGCGVDMNVALESFKQSLNRVKQTLESGELMRPVYKRRKREEEEEEERRRQRAEKIAERRRIRLEEEERKRAETEKERMKETEREGEGKEGEGDGDEDALPIRLWRKGNEQNKNENSTAQQNENENPPNETQQPRTPPPPLSPTLSSPPDSPPPPIPLDMFHRPNVSVFMQNPTPPANKTEETSVGGGGGSCAGGVGEGANGKHSGVDGVEKSQNGRGEKKVEGGEEGKKGETGMERVEGKEGVDVEATDRKRKAGSGVVEGENAEMGDAAVGEADPEGKNPKKRQQKAKPKKPKEENVEKKKGRRKKDRTIQTPTPAARLYRSITEMGLSPSDPDAEVLRSINPLLYYTPAGTKSFPNSGNPHSTSRAKHGFSASATNNILPPPPPLLPPPPPGQHDTDAEILRQVQPVFTFMSNIQVTRVQWQYLPHARKPSSGNVGHALHSAPLPAPTTTTTTTSDAATNQGEARADDGAERGAPSDPHTAVLGSVQPLTAGPPSPPPPAVDPFLEGVILEHPRPPTPPSMKPKPQSNGTAQPTGAPPPPMPPGPPVGYVPYPYSAPGVPYTYAPSSALAPAPTYPPYRGYYYSQPRSGPMYYPPPAQGQPPHPLSSGATHQPPLYLQGAYMRPSPYPPGPYQVPTPGSTYPPPPTQPGSSTYGPGIRPHPMAAYPTWLPGPGSYQPPPGQVPPAQKTAEPADSHVDSAAESSSAGEEDTGRSRTGASKRDRVDKLLSVKERVGANLRIRLRKRERLEHETDDGSEKGETNGEREEEEEEEEGEGEGGSSQNAKSSKKRGISVYMYRPEETQSGDGEKGLGLAWQKIPSGEKKPNEPNEA